MSAGQRRRLRVVFSIDNMGVGGTELNALRTARLLDRERYELSVVCLQSDGPLLEGYAAAGIAVQSFPLPSLHEVATVRQFARLARHLRAERVDIVHAHDVYSNLFTVPAARWAGVPAVIASRRWWLNRGSRARRLANRFAYRLAGAVLANAPRVADMLIRHEGVPAGKVAVVPNFVDEAAFVRLAEARRRSLLSELGVPAQATVVGVVANLRPVKDHETLLRAAARMATLGSGSVHLLLIGDGERRQALENLAMELGLGDHCHFAGRMVEPFNLHSLFDISVLCSVNEAFSNSVLEAMAAGNPVVATAVGAMADAVMHQRTGWLVPPRDPARLAAALDRLVEDPQLRLRWGAAGAARVRERFTPAVALGELEALYQRLLARGTAARPAPAQSLEDGTAATLSSSTTAHEASA